MPWPLDFCSLYSNHISSCCQNSHAAEITFVGLYFFQFRKPYNVCWASAALPAGDANMQSRMPHRLYEYSGQWPWISLSGMCISNVVRYFCDWCIDEVFILLRCCLYLMWAELVRHCQHCELRYCRFNTFLWVKPTIMKHSKLITCTHQSVAPGAET